MLFSTAAAAACPMANVLGSDSHCHRPAIISYCPQLLRRRAAACRSGGSSLFGGGKTLNSTWREWRWTNEVATALKKKIKDVIKINATSSAAVVVKKIFKREPEPGRQSRLYRQYFFCSQGMLQPKSMGRQKVSQLPTTLIYFDVQVASQKIRNEK